MSIHRLAILGSVIVAACASPVKEAALNADPSIPKYNNPECQKARKAAIDYGNGEFGRGVVDYGLAIVPFLGTAGSIMAEQSQGKDAESYWDTLEKACGQEVSFPVVTEMAKDGNASAQAWLGQAYVNGIGVKQDYVQAAHWYDLAARHHDTAAEVNLGMLYYKGFGVPQNYKQAAKLWQNASDEGVPEADDDLAELYIEGNGVQRDYGEARLLLHLSATKGHGPGQMGLAQMYEQGLGTQSDVLAYVWYNIAARYKVAGAYDKQVAEYKKLSDEQRRTADKQLDRCVASGLMDCP